MLAISLLVLLHEGGHFFFAKLFGVRVDKFQRLLIMIGGVLVNFLLALFIYGQILFWWGDTYIPVKDMTMGMKFNQEAKSYGFKDGDILVGTDTKAFKEFSADLYRDISEAKRVDILRDGKPMSISLPGDLNLLNMIKADPAFVRPLLPARIDSVMAGSPAEKAGLKAGNHILALNGAPVDSYNEFIDLLGRREDLLLTAKTPADSLKARTVTIVFGSDAKADPY